MKRGYISNQPHRTANRNALGFSVLLLVLLLGSIIALLLPQKAPEGYIAEIYQSGIRIHSLSLSDVQESYTFTIEDGNGHVNEIEVRPDSIGIVSASCPDKLCIKQGFITDSRLPVTCLPNKIVIWLRPASDADSEPDIITY